MNPEALQCLLVAKILYNKSIDLCESGDRYMASAGLVMLQDALESVLYAILIEKKVDEKERIEDYSFPKLLTKVRELDLKIPKSGTLRALNDQRRTVKHLGQLAEPASVKNFRVVSDTAINTLLKQVYSKELHEILLLDLLKDGKAKDYLESSQAKLDQGDLHDALVEIRKAVFEEFEKDYAIDRWKNMPDSPVGLGLQRKSRGLRAPFYTRNPKYIAENVKEPFDLIRLDHNQLRGDLMEWGIDPLNFMNITRLTPSVFRFENTNEWIVKREPRFSCEEVDVRLVRQCLDLAISVLLKKQEHAERSKYLWGMGARKVIACLVHDQPLYSKADVNSPIIGQLSKGQSMNILHAITGSDKYDFVSVCSYLFESRTIQIGFVPSDAVDFVKEDS